MRTIRKAAAALALLVTVAAPAALVLAQEQGVETAPSHVEHSGGKANLEDAPPVARKLFRDLVCMCGGCKRETLEACTCSYARQMREKVMAILATQDLTTEKGQDKAYVAVRDAFMKEYGGQIVLTVPIDTGFNRLGWIVPWVVFGLALGLVVIVGRRFVRRGRAETAAFAAAAAAPAPAKSAKDEELEDRLEDELRDID